MPLKEEFEKSGNWLFRWRGCLPIWLIGLFLLVMWQHQYPKHSSNFEHYWATFCLFVSYLGLGIRLLTIGYTPKDTSGRNTEKQDAGSLNTTGIYSLVRNPLYLGNFFMHLGIALFTQIWWLVALFVLIFWLYYERIIFAEESFLREKFGQQYMTWATRTPAMIPNIKGYQKPMLPFSCRNVLKREYNGFFAVILVMFVFETVRNLAVSGKLVFESEWVVLLGGATLIWLFLRTLKKHTKVLHVEGR